MIAFAYGNTNTFAEVGGIAQWFASKGEAFAILGVEEAQLHSNVITLNRVQAAGNQVEVGFVE
ncbi:hypothetical protein D3C80_2188170 [compost metagenome]